jgi:hypothetical protein
MWHGHVGLKGTLRGFPLFQILCENRPFPVACIWLHVLARVREVLQIYASTEVDGCTVYRVRVLRDTSTPAEEKRVRPPPAASPSFSSPSPSSFPSFARGTRVGG